MVGVRASVSEVTFDLAPAALSSNCFRTEPSVGWLSAVLRHAPHGCEDIENAGYAVMKLVCKFIHSQSRVGDDVGCHQPQTKCVNVNGNGYSPI